MIIARAPARVSFGGGGTDLAAYYERHGGLVVSAAIARYCTVVVNPTDDGSISLRSDSVGIFKRWSHGVRPEVDGPHKLGAAAIGRFFDDGLSRTGAEVVITSDIPHGSGLGSSSTVTVALVAALAECTGQRLTRSEVADIACDIEINRLGMPIGRQDQYASAFGGLNLIEFDRSGTSVTPLDLSDDLLDALDSRLLLFSTGRTRQAADILDQQRRDTTSNAQVLESLHVIKGLARQMIDVLQHGDLDAFGRLLDTCWQEKKRLSSRISSGDINRWYEAAREAGALGGKICGAGGGGFLMLYCPPDVQARIREVFERIGLAEMRVSFDTHGVSVQTVKENAFAGVAVQNRM